MVINIWRWCSGEAIMLGLFVMSLVLNQLLSILYGIGIGTEVLEMMVEAFEDLRRSG